MIALEAPISIELYWLVRDETEWIRLLVFFGAGLFLFLFTALVEKSWSLPLASCLIVIAFFAVAAGLGQGITELRDSGWLFDIPQTGSAFELLGDLDLRQVDSAFLIDAIPEILTILFLTTLAASMNLSAMNTTQRNKDTGVE